MHRNKPSFFVDEFQFIFSENGLRNDLKRGWSACSPCLHRFRMHPARCPSSGALGRHAARLETGVAH